VRSLPARSSLPTATLLRLANEADEVANSIDSVATAAARYASARKATWFRPVVRALVCLAGLGQRCMYCSGSESAQVEHFRPKVLRPELAFEWSNLLWVCGICNLAKGDRFEVGTPPIDPFVESPWDYFFIDQFGNLTPKWDSAADDFDARAKHTLELYGLDRQALQETREERLVDLRGKVIDSLTLFQNGAISREDLEMRVLNWLEQPFQPDVADFFIAGPGALEHTEPFQQLITTLES